VPYGAAVMVDDGDSIRARDVVVEWDPHVTPMLAEAPGFVRFQDIVDGETVRFEQEGRSESKRVVIEHKGDKHPRIIIEDKEGKILDFHHLPAKARIEGKEGDPVKPGTLLARQPRAKCPARRTSPVVCRA
jgi:DNA-directed RNA polymerase subunit beta'